MAATTNLKECIISHGPWGGSKGKDWIYIPVEGYIKKISIVHGGVIDSIKFQSDCNIRETQKCSFGGKGGNRTDTICIDYPKEYLTSINGTIGSYGGHEVVKSISFHTNQYCYGPYGSDSGPCFKYDGKGGAIVGFHGRFDTYLDAIGIYVMPKSLALARNFTFESNATNEAKKVDEVLSVKAIAVVEALESKVEKLKKDFDARENLCKEMEDQRAKHAVETMTLVTATLLASHQTMQEQIAALIRRMSPTDLSQDSDTDSPI